MSRNGSGTYSLPAGNPVVTGTTIASTWANNTMNDLASAMTDSVAADGQTAMTGNLNLNSNKIVNLATPTLSNDAVTKAYADALVGGAGSFTTLTSSGATTFTAGTASTSTTTGTAVITGGLGVSGRINAANFDGIVGANTAAAGSFTTLSATGVTTVQAGTAALPAITTTGDTNTGIFFPAADTIAFSEGGTEAMRIDGSGNVGIGATSAGNKLQVSNGGANGLEVDVVFNSGAETKLLSYNRSGSAYTPLNYDGSIHKFILSSVTEAMRITSTGQLFVNNTTDIISGALDNVQIGCTAPSSSIQYGMMIGGNGTTYTVNAIRFVNTYTPAVVGTITIGSSSTAYNTSSDYRLKENVAPMTGALAKVAQLKPVTYTWKATGETSQGFIAHELQAIVPDCVTGEKDAVDEEGNPVHQGIDTSFLVATLTAAIQELKAELDATKAEVQALKGVS